MKRLVAVCANIPWADQTHDPASGCSCNIFISENITPELHKKAIKSYSFGLKEKLQINALRL